uniref:Uncharacterized protein n=1 Tax=Leersia perrieri TaxID=77586 RepID=A0A0D9UXP1_9ORYZ
MASSAMFRGLTRITSSIANHGVSRVLSFTGSFNDLISLLHNAEGSPPSTAAVAADSPAQNHDVEVPAPAPAIGLDQAADEAKRVSKSVQTVSLFAASASLVMFVNLPGAKNDQPPPPAWRAALQSVTLAFICLGLFTSLGLSMFSIVATAGDGDAAVARAQKAAMVTAVACVLVSFTLRMCMTLPGVLAAVFLLLVAGAGAGAGIYLSLAGRRRQIGLDEEAGDAAVQLTSTEPSYVTT